jgi:hypothetical protein
MRNQTAMNKEVKEDTTVGGGFEKAPAKAETGRGA